MSDFATIYNAYRNANLPNAVSLEDFARAGKEWTQSPTFDAAARGGIRGAVNRGSYWLDQALNATGVPEAAGEAGAQAFSFFGGDPEAGRETGSSLPRMMVDMAPMIIAGLASGGTVPAAALVGSSALGAANALEKTDSLASAATAGVMPFVGSLAGKAASSAAQKAFGWTEETLANSLLQRLGNYSAGQAGGLVAMEGTNTAASLAQGHGLPTYDRNFVLSSLMSQIPFAIADAPHLMKPVRVEAAREQQIAQVEQAPISEVSKVQEKQAINLAADRQTEMNFDEPVKKKPFQEDAKILSALGKFKNGTPEGAEMLNLEGAPLEGQPIEDLEPIRHEIEQRVELDGDSTDEAIERTQEKNRGGRPQKMAYVDAAGDTVHIEPKKAEAQGLAPKLDESGKHLSMHEDRQVNGLWKVLDNKSSDPKLKAAILTLDGGKWISELEPGRQTNDILSYFDRLYKAYKKGNLETVVKKKLESGDTIETQFAKLLRSAGKLAKSRPAKTPEIALNENHVSSLLPKEPAANDLEELRGHEAAQDELVSVLESDTPDTHDLATALAEMKNQGKVIQLEQTEPGKLSKLPAEADHAQLLDFVKNEANSALTQSEPQKYMEASLARLSSSQLDRLNVIKSKKTGAKLRAEIATKFLESVKMMKAAGIEAFSGNNGQVLERGRPAGASFFYGLASYDPVKNKLGKHTLPRSGTISEEQLRQIGGDNKPLKQAEVDLYKELVPDAFSAGNVHVPTLDKQLNEAAPVISVRKLSADGAANPDKLEYNELLHELDTKASGWRGMNSDSRERLYPELTTKFDRIYELQRTKALWETENSEAATGKYGVEPYDMEYLSGNVSRQDGLQKALWAGDIVGQLPRRAVPAKGDLALERTKFQSQHYGTEAGKNQLFFVRGVLHEFLPGAKLPTGEVATKPTKMFEAWENQSDWSAQKAEIDKQYPQSSAYKDNELRAIQHPLLDLWEPLALKAAIAQAKQMGAEYFALSDAESAMMTEGHDQYATVRYPVHLKEGQWIAKRKFGTGVYLDEVKGTSRAEIQKALDNHAFGDEYEPYQITKEDVTHNISQEPGMRLHYDKTGPSILSKLTGDKGRVGDFGVHEKAKERGAEISNRANATRLNEQTRELIALYDAGQISQEEYFRRDKENVDKAWTPGSKVFRTPEGTPKTQNTARVFSLEKLSPEVSRFNIGGMAEVGSRERLTLEPSMENMFRRAAQKKGIPENQISSALPFIKSLADKWNMQDVRFGELLSDAPIEGQSPQGLGTISGPVRKMWLAANEKFGGGNLDWAKNMLVLTAHEGGHLLDHLYRMDQLGAKAKGAYERVLAWKDAATPEELSNTLRDAAESLLPESWRNQDAFKEMMNPANGDEALATLHGIWSLSSIHKEADAVLAASLMPAQGRSFFRLLSDTAKSFIGAMRSAFFGKKQYDTADQLKMITGSFAQMKRGVEIASKNLGELSKFYSYDPAQFEVIKASQLQLLQDASVPNSIKELARFMGTSEEELPNAPKGVLGTIGHEVSRAFENLNRLLEHAPVFAKAGAALLNTPGTARQLATNFFAPVFGEIDASGRIVAGSKAAKKEQQLWAKDKSVNSLISKIDNWQQKENAKDVGGQLFDLVNPKNSDAGIAQELAALSPEKRQAVASYFTKHLAQAREIQSAELEARRFANTKTLAKIIAARKPAFFDIADKLATYIHQGAEFAVRGDAMSNSMMRQEALKLGIDVNTMLEMENFARGSVKDNLDLQEFYANRPGFTSMMRVGEYGINAWDANGTQVQFMVPAENAARASAMAAAFQKDGLKTKIEKLSRGSKFSIDEEYQTFLDSLDQRMLRNLDAAFGGRVPQAELEKFAQDFSYSGQLKQATLVNAKLLPTLQGRSLKGMEEFDIVRQHILTTQIQANAIAKLKAKAEYSFQKMNPKFKDVNLEHLVRQLDDAFKNYMIPDNDLAGKFNKMGATFFLGANIPNSFAELFQPFTTIVSQATAEFGAADATKMLMGVLKDTMKQYGKKLTGGNVPLSDEELMIQTLTSRGVLNRSSLHEALDELGSQGVAVRFQQQGSKFSYLGSVTQALANSTMRFYEVFNRHNAAIAARLGYRLGKEKMNLDHVEATQFAERFAERSAYSGSRATRSITPYNEGHRGLGQIAMLMQSYMTNYVGQMVRHVQRGWFMDNAQLKGYGHDQAPGGIEGVRARSKQAALMLIGSQFLAAGAMGLPFMGPAVKLFEDMTGEDLKGDVYQAFGKMMDQDSQEGSILADGMMRGYANTLLEQAGLPLDIGGRFAISGAPGLSEYDGFDANKLFGPTGGLVKSIVTGLSQAARDHDLMPLTKSVAPVGLKKAIDLALNGDATDNNSNKMGLDDSEKVLYGLGFTPTRVRKLKEFERMAQAATTARRTQQDLVEAQIADEMQVNPLRAQTMLMQQSQKLGVDPRALATGVVEKQTKSLFPKDFRQDVPALDVETTMNLLKGIGANPGPTNEMQKAQAQAQLYAKLGLAPRQGAMQRASKIDAATQSNPFLPLAAASKRNPASPW